MLRYSLSWGDPHERLYDVSITFTAPADGPLLHLPVWRPGRYLVQNYAANVREWSANLEKVGKSTWRAEARAGAAVTVRYRFYAGVLDAGSSFLDADEAYFNGSNLFMMVEGARGEPCELTISASADWRIETQLERIDAQTFRARDYDHLIDSPTIASPSLTVHSFEESGATIHLVFKGADGIDTAQFVEPVRAIVREQAAMFGGLPLRDYRFLYHVTDRWHGVEHEDSCSITAKRAALLNARPGDDGFDHFLSITSHEFFHLWNVKRILPAAFAPYDYSRETPTRLLWAMEGITSYYGELTLVRAGLWDESRYLRHLAEEIELLESSPARAHLPLTQSSYDAWLQDPAQNHDRPNAWFSFYNKGEVVAALLDLALRQRGRSLDELMQQLWREYGQTDRGLEEDALHRVAGDELADFFARYVDGTNPLPYAELLAAAAVSFHSRPREAGLGAKLKRFNGRLGVESVVRGGAAMAAGLLPHDELIAVSGQRVVSESEVRALVRDAEVELLIARAGIIKTLWLVPRPDGSADIKLMIDAMAGEAQHELRRGWLKRGPR